ncbi:MAG: hypothetical protein Ta2A_15930 [Treponemataceae bacterium]|nr:MAG: hypothetical protein Ta2A_15930 [Treponemataceae bacterium]
MSYEGTMLEKLSMPTRKEVEVALLTTLFNHNGIIKEFSSGEEIVNEIADMFVLNEEQRKTELERIYKKENRIVKTPLWHRLLYRAADTLAKEKLVTRPTTTLLLTERREWMLTEKGIDKAMSILNIASEQKKFLPVKTFEVQEEIKNITAMPLPRDYNPIGSVKSAKIISREMSIRSRSFRQAIINVYDYTCCVCGLKIQSPDSLHWEVEAAHIVPHGSQGKDDIWNGIALCRLHHWAFDTGWFSVTDEHTLVVSSQIKNTANDCSMGIGNSFFKNSLTANKPIILPKQDTFYPHKLSLEWHRQHILFR